jgi:hypothetical protein
VKYIFLNVLNSKKGDEMNKKWWRYAMIGVLLFDLCLVAIQAGSVVSQGKHTAPWPQGLQKTYPEEVSFDPSSPTAQTAGKLTVTTVFLLMAITLM